MAEGALIAAGVTAATAATVVTYAKYALLIYGLYSGYRSRQKAKRAAYDSLDDRSITINSTDMARSIVYGEQVVGGRVAYAIEPRDVAATIDGFPRPASPFFYLVMALEPDHEVEGITDILFDGQPVGPWQGDLNTNSEGTGYYVSNQSKYYKSRTAITTNAGTVSASGIIEVPGLVIIEVMALEISTTDVPPGSEYLSGDNRPDYIYTQPAPVSYAVSLGGVIVDPAYAGKAYNLTFRYQINKPLVRAWFYKGTPTQNANATVMAASGGEWNSRCRLRGIPYIAMEINPDLDIFQGGLPEVTAIIRGKKALSIGGAGQAYSRNPADCIYDYLRFNFEVRADEVYLPTLLAAKNACDEQVQYGLSTPNPNAPIPTPYFEPRYRCDIVLSTEASPRENLGLLLATMSGTATWSAGRFDIRAGVAQIAEFSLDDSDLASDQLTVRPELPDGESFNAVRGRYVQKLVFTESEKIDDITTIRNRITYTTTDFPPYKSSVYATEDAGIVRWKEIDLPGVTSVYQAQRIALLQLRQSRNALSFQATYKAVAAQISAGQVVNITVESFGWLNKPFYLMKREPQPDRTIKTVWTEAAPAIFDPKYSELTQPDPAPNTRLTPVTDVGKVKNLTLQSGPEFARFLQDGTVQAVVLAKWDRSTEAGILYGGRIELWYKYGTETEWRKTPLLPGEATRYEIPITRSQQVVVTVRQMNGAQICGEWETKGHFAEFAPTGIVSGNRITNASFTCYEVDELSRTHEFFNWAVFALGTADPMFQPDPELSPVSPPILQAVPQDAEIVNFTIDGLGVGRSTGSIRPVNQISIDPKYRYVAAIRMHVALGEAWVRVTFTNAAEALLTTTDSEVFIFPPAAVQSLSDLRTISVFVTAPETAVKAQVEYFARQSTTMTTNSVVRVSQPYFGYALAGQIQLPPWTK